MNESIEYNKNIRTRWNKKGGEKLLSLWWFFILGVIGGFIVLGVIIYYSADTNVNLIEANILVDKLTECLIIKGNLNEDIFNEEFNIFKECNLDAKMLGMGSFIYFNVSIYDSNDLLIKEFINGSGTFELDCRVGMKINAKNFPSCIYETYFSNFENQIHRIKILGGVNQIGGKIPITN